MLTYDLSKRGKTPAYEYIYSCIKNDILNGRIKANEKLPSKRSFALNLGVSLITVVNAYEILMVEGYVVGIEKKGYFVNDIGIVSEKKEEEKEIIEPSEPEEKYLADFSSGHILYDNFPYTIWTRLMRKTLMDREGLFLKSPLHQGVYSLRKNIAEHLSEFRGLKVSPENIVVGAGTEYLYSLIVQLIGRSGMIAVEDPGHVKVSRVYEANGIKVVHIPVDDQGLSLEGLKNSGAKAVHISPSHQFPTGSVMSAKRRHGIIKWASEKGGYIIEDDYDSEFGFLLRPMPTVKELAKDRVIYMNTFSRTLSPSIRIAYMVLPDELMEKYHSKLGFYSSTVSGMEQMALAAFIEEGFYGRHLNRMKNYYRKLHIEITDIIKETLPDKLCRIEGEACGLHFVIRLNTDITDEEFTERLYEKGIKIKPVNDYAHYKREGFKHCFVISYSEINPKIMKKAAEIIFECLLGKEKS
ncbi:MAG: PLP-dependent aminotransferase family protein [Eubacterium sp.]|nr:PLP-dependent aminotransferase family protein [Eubacterium sp.]